jgi:ribosomal protein L23
MKKHLILFAAFILTSCNENEILRVKESVKFEKHDSSVIKLENLLNSSENLEENIQNVVSSKESLESENRNLKLEIEKIKKENQILKFQVKEYADKKPDVKNLIEKLYSIHVDSLQIKIKDTIN